MSQDLDALFKTLPRDQIEKLASGDQGAISAFQQSLKPAVEQNSTPSVPALDPDEVFKTMRRSDVAKVQAGDLNTYNSAVSRYQGFQERWDKGEDPIRANDFSYWDWADRAGKLHQNLGHVVVEAAKGVTKGLFNLGSEVMASEVEGYRDHPALKMKLSGAFGPIGGLLASERFRDLASVGGAKTLAGYNSLVRGAGQLLGRASTSAAKLFVDDQSREVMEETYRRNLFGAKVKNQADFDLASNFHKEVTAAIPALQGIVGTTEVDQSAAEGFSAVADPTNFVGAGLALKTTRVLGEAGARMALKGEMENTLIKVAAKREEVAAAQSVLDAAKTARSAGVPMDIEAAAKDLSELQSHVTRATEELGVAEQAIANHQAAQTAELERLTQATLSRLAAGKALSVAGKAAEIVGGIGERIRSLPSKLAERLAPESEYLQGELAKYGTGAAVVGVGIATDNDAVTGAGAFIGASPLLRRAGADIRRIGELYSVGETVLPFWQQVRKARDISGLTKQAGAFLDNSVFAATADVVKGAARGTAAAVVPGAAFGIVASPDDPLAGAASGMGSAGVFGFAVGAFGQWKKYDNPGQRARELAGQVRAYRDLLQARPDELVAFDKLKPDQQSTIALYLSVHPDLKVNYIDAPGAPAGRYDAANPDVVTINLASKDPLKEVLAHEVSHYVERNELGQTVEDQYLGDAEAGIAGEFTARHEISGDPILVMENGVKRFKMNAEFEQYRQRYTEQAKASGVDTTFDDSYIAREIFAERHVDYLLSDSYAKDLKGLTSASDFIDNAPFLKETLGRLGVVFDKDGGVVESKLLGKIGRDPTTQKLLREYYRRRAEDISGRIDPDADGRNKYFDEKAVNKSTQVAEKYFDATGEILRDTAGKPIYDENGKAQIRKAIEVKRDVADAATAAAAVIEAQKPSDPAVVQKRTDEKGNSILVGRYLSDEAIAAIEKSEKLNPVQLQNLKELNAQLKDGGGKQTLHFYQAATRKGGGPLYRSLAGRWRTDLVYGVRVTKADNIAFQSISLEVLMENAKASVAKGQAKPWNNQLGDLIHDINTYVDNVTSGKPGSQGLGDEKKNFINNLLGIRIKKNGDVNPLFEVMNAPKIILTTLRLDRMNRLSPVEARKIPFTSESYRRAAQNLRPETSPNKNTTEGESIIRSVAPRIDDVDHQFRPETNDETVRVARSYVEDVLGRKYEPHQNYEELPAKELQDIADFLDLTEHMPDDPEVKASYEALKEETKAQYETMVAAGIQIEPWSGKGEPYKSSTEMMADVAKNKHLYFLLTDQGFGSSAGPENHPLLESSGVKVGDRELVYNDLFRAVHDYFGHTQQGFQFGPRGEFNAWKSHSTMFSDEAQGALAAETLAQNAWVNNGKHLRRPDGTVPAKGEEGYVPPQERRFADQKAFVLPDELIAAVRDNGDMGIDETELLGSREQLRPETADGKKVRRVLRSNEVSRILMDESEARSGPFDGGCLIVAKALQRHFGKGELVRLVSDANGGQTEHYGLQVGEVIFDAAGEHSSPEKWAANFKKQENFTRPLIVESGFDESSEIPDDPHATKLVTSELDRHVNEAGQLRPETKSDASVGDKELKLIHFSSRQGLTQLDPKKMGSAYANREDRMGANKTFFFVQGSKYGQDGGLVATKDKQVYGATISGKKIYDFNRDPLDVASEVNRFKRESTIQDAGYDGYYVATEDGRKVVAMFKPTKVEPIDGARAQFRPETVSTVPVRRGTETLDLGERPSALDIGRALADRSRQAKRIPYDSRTKEARESIATALADEISYAVEQDKNALGWYERKTSEAMATLAEIHPEIAEDPARGALYKAILAITSNGQAVTDNFFRAEELYRGWKETGRIESDSQWGGQRSAAINGGLSLLQRMVNEQGLEATAGFLGNKYRFGDIKKLAKEVLGIDIGSSEPVDHTVPGSIIFGPKVGGGFYPNLNGDFTPITMDLWLMRTWNRINGSFGRPDPVGMGRAIEALRTAATENPDAQESAEIGRLSDRQLGNWAEKRFTDWKNVRKFKDATAFDRPAKRFVEAKEGAQEAPRNGSERAWVREVFTEVDRQLDQKGLPPINNADKQALLWYYEKDLYTKLGYRDNKGKPADYAEAARQVLEYSRATVNSR
jgi:hypothetical protein